MTLIVVSEKSTAHKRKPYVWRLCHRLSCALVAGAVLAIPAIGYSQIARSWNTTSGDWSIPINWLPNGVPGVNDGAFIGNLAVAENGIVTLDQDDTVAGVQISNGMRLQTSGNTLTVLGDTTITGEGLFEPRPVLDVSRGDGIDDYDTDNLTLNNQGEVRLRNGAILEVDEMFTLGDQSRVFGDGVIRLIGAGEVLQNDGQIDPWSGGMIFNVTGGGVLDLDGSQGDGSLTLQTFLVDGSAFANMAINGGVLTDSFSGRISMFSNNALAMNLDEPWVADSSSTISVMGSEEHPGPSVLSGIDVALGGRVVVSRNIGLAHFQIEADATFRSTADVVIGTNDELGLNGTTVVEGGTFTIEDQGIIRFEGPTTIQGGNFISLTDNPGFDMSVALEGETLYTGNVTFTGLTRQLGDARVGLATVITAEVFDMDGAAASPTTWDIDAATTINADRIEGGIASNPPFVGTINVSGSIATRLTLNLSDPSEAWVMAGTMNLTGNVAFYITRLAGSPVDVTGDLNTSARVAIAADASFSDSSTIDFASAETILRMTGRTTVEDAATFAGQGVLENGVSGTMSLAAGLSTGQVGVVNHGRLELGETVGVVAVDRFQNVTDATLVVDVGRNTIGTDSDVLTISSGAADVAGFVQPNIVNVGGSFQPPMVGDSFTILTAVGGVNGTFDDVRDSLLGGLVYEWSAIHNPSDVVIEVAAIGGLLGDYNRNGVVDAPDYVVWRKTFGSTTSLQADGSMNGMVDMNDYDVWRANFGQPDGSGAALASVKALSTVPEPAVPTMLLTGLVLSMFFRRRSEYYQAW